MRRWNSRPLDIQDNARKRRISALKSSRTSMDLIRILHLEDNERDSQLVAHILQSEGLAFALRRAGSKQEFMDALRDGPLDLVLAVYSLPDLSGVGALKLARESHPDLPFIFVSGISGEEIAIEALKSGATDYVLKKRLDRLPASVMRALTESAARYERDGANDSPPKTEKRFQAIADSAPVLIWMTGTSRECTFFNKPWLSFTGRRFDQEVGLGWTASLHPDDLERWDETFGRHFDQQTPFTTEVRLRRHDGEFRWLVINGAPHFSPVGKFLGFIGSCIDLTDIKKTEERLRHVAKLESLGILAGGIAHDFNNLLTGILGHAHLLMDDLDAEDPRLPLVRNVIQAGDAAAQLTRQMLAYSGRGRFIIEAVDLSSLLHDSRALIEASIPRAVRISYQLDPELPRVDADPGQLQQIVMNLIINAGEAAEDTQGTVSVKTYRREVRDGSLETNLTSESLSQGIYAVLEVSDDGHGMDGQTRAKIFDPFFTTKFTGRGLGLAAVLGIVRGHKGAIQLMSEPGVGSTFRVLLPESEIHARLEPVLDETFPGRGTGTVLVVDDVPLVLSTVQLTLQRAGFSVITAPHGQSALDILRRSPQRVDLVLLDMTMPVLGGEQTLLQIKEIREDLPVVGMSGFSEVEALRRFGERLDGFIQKPFPAAHLLRVIWSALERGGRAMPVPL